MRLLLIEDEIEHCNLYEQYVATIDRVDLLITADCEQALTSTTRHKPDVVLLDLEMHYGYGDGLLYLNKLNMTKAENHPLVIVITRSPSVKTHNIARTLGADYIFLKNKPDYTAQMVVDFAITVYDRLGVHKPLAVQHKTPALKSNVLRDKISAAIATVGITHDMRGRLYIIDAIEIAIKSENNDIRLTKDVYPVIGAKYNKKAFSIDSAIATAIKKAWRLTDLSILQKNYKAAVRYTTGTPSNKEFIFYFRDKLRA